MANLEILKDCINKGSFAGFTARARMELLKELNKLEAKSEKPKKESYKAFKEREEVK